MEPRISIVTLGVDNLQKSYEFYTALGFPSSKNPEDGIIFFKTGGVCLALYPLDELAKDVSPDFDSNRSGFSGVTLVSYSNTQTKSVGTLKIRNLFLKIFSLKQKVFPL